MQFYFVEVVWNEKKNCTFSQTSNPFVQGMEYNLTTFYLGTTLVLLVITSCNSALLASQSARGRMFDTTVIHSE